MAATPTIKSSGTQSASISTEHSLLDTTDAGVYVFAVDKNAMANDDVVELRIKTKVLSGGTKRVMYKKTYKHAQSVDDLISMSVAVVVPNGAEFTLKQIAGTGRSFPWAIYAL